MRFSRRSMLKGGALAGSALAVPAVAVELQRLPVVVFDSRIPESVAFAATQAGVQTIDLAQSVDAGWRKLGDPARVTGLTRWSDWTALRGALEEKGLRMTQELRAAAPLSGRDHLFRWTMIAR